MSGTTTEEDEAFLKMDKHAQQCFHLARGEKGSSVYVNPMVTITSFVMIWIFVIVCVVEPDRMLKAMNIVAFAWIPEVWTWFYIVSQNIWIVVLLYMCFSKAGDLKLGKDDDKPEYSFATWFSMLFSAGVAVGLFYYSVYEPVAYYKKGRWESVQRGYGNDNEDATHALMVSWFHWGLHGWIPYTTMGAIMALMSYRRGFPMTVRYCLWPLIGDRCYGWMGDAVDILSVVTTIFGVCTSLGLGAMQVNQGLQRLNHGFYRGTNYAIPAEEKFSTPTCGGTGSACADGKESYGIQVNTATQIVIIIVITVLATTSVASGVNKGIVTLSRINFALGMFICLTVLFIGETYFILDVIVQTAGYYIWYIWKIAFQTDAYERLGGKSLGLGGAPDGLGGTSGWLSGWTLFYWGWWISWAPFVGIFLAKISKGRTLRQFIVGTLIIPSVYSFFWFGVFGAEGIRMQRMADGSGLCSVNKASGYCSGGEKEQLASSCGNFAAQFSTATKTNLSVGWTPKCVLDPSYHDGFGRCKQFAWTRYVEVGDQCVKSTKWVDVPCGGTTRRLLPKPSCTSSSNNDPTQLEYGCFEIMSSSNSLPKSVLLPLQEGLRRVLNITNSTDSLPRKIFLATSATFFGVAATSLGYKIFRNYRLNKKINDSNRLFQAIDFEASLTNSMLPEQEIEEIERRLIEFKLSDETLLQIMEILDMELDKGLKKITNAEADIKMLPTYVTKLPTGNESNDILALDLGGSNFRVLLIRLRKNEEPKILNKVFIVSESISKGSGTKLFNHIANCLYLFMKTHNLDLNKTYPLGFTFSFPCYQAGFENAFLLRWTKGFNCAEVVGENVVNLLQKAIDNRGDIKVKVLILINDTVGTLMSCAYKDPRTAIGLILGTGTNACYIEKIEKIETVELDAIKPEDKEMIVNTEWGALGENGNIDFIRSRYDEEIDKTSINVGKQIFEKMVSGMYLGEIVRLMILDLIDRELIFREEMQKDSYRHALFTKGSFYTKYLSEIESDSNARFSKTKRILKELAGIENPCIQDCAVVKYICNSVTKRAAQLIAAGIAVILKRMKKSDVTIAVDGSLFRFHPRLKIIMEGTLRKLVEPTTKFQLILSTDGSGRGAAVVAAVAASNKISLLGN